MLEHGGHLRQAARRYDIPLKDWLDLSTGINPNGWGVPPIPASHWARLPEDDDGLNEAAQDYYGTKYLLPVAGSQAAIQTLPLLRPSCRVAIIHPGYGEHAHAWSRAGHQVQPVSPHLLGQSIANSDVVILIHPNNPTGQRFSVDEMLEWHEDLASRGGWLVIDEAFMDSTPEHSLLPFSGKKGLIILRSLGKFFGLAGARIGFVSSHVDLMERLQNRLGPWPLNGPARYIATKALLDKSWQKKTRKHLKADGQHLESLLAKHNLAPSGGCDLFQWITTNHAIFLHEELARQAILTRLFQDPLSLRFGLPAGSDEWNRLDDALKIVSISL